MPLPCVPPPKRRLGDVAVTARCATVAMVWAVGLGCVARGPTAADGGAHELLHSGTARIVRNTTKRVSMSVVLSRLRNENGADRTDGVGTDEGNSPGSHP